MQVPECRVDAEEQIRDLAISKRSPVSSCQENVRQRDETRGEWSKGVCRRSVSINKKIIKKIFKQATHHCDLVLYAACTIAEWTVMHG